jgi:hypothetical protein
MQEGTFPAGRVYSGKPDFHEVLIFHELRKEFFSWVSQFILSILFILSVSTSFWRHFHL